MRYVEDKPNDFRPHADGTGSFSEFVVSSQMRRPLVRAAHDVIAVATRIAPKGSGEYARGFKVGRKLATSFKARGQKRGLRAVAVVENEHDAAAALEFGSGSKSLGDSTGRARPQGGGNKPYRVLGRAGGQIGDWHE